MSLPIIFMYSGQGSQYYQMGKELFLSHKIFKQYCLHAEEIFRKLTGYSLIESVYAEQHKKSDMFSQTIFTHPAIFMVEYALTQVVLAYNIKPSAVMGTSMGEFAAATAAGMMRFETALEVVIKQAQSLEKYCEKGGMLAILGDPQLYREKSFLFQLSELAAINFSSHFVVSGRVEHLNEIKGRLNEENIISQVLPVSFAFHSPLIDHAAHNFLESIANLQLQENKIPFISCTNGKTLESPTFKHWWDIIRAPILFQQTIQTYEQNHAAVYLDLGPSGTLATFVKYILAAHSLSKQMTIMSPYGQENKYLEEAVSRFK